MVAKQYNTQYYSFFLMYLLKLFRVGQVVKQNVNADLAQYLLTLNEINGRMDFL